MAKDFLINGNPQNIPKKKGGDNMFYAAPKEWIEENMPDLAAYQPEKTRIFFTEPDGQIRFADRIHGYYFSDRHWGRGEDERLVEGLDQEFVDKSSYLSVNIRNTLRAPDGWTFVSCDYAAQELRLGAINTKGKAFLTAFMNNEDVHLSVAKAMFGEAAVKENKKKYRSIAKGLNFSMQYGGSAGGLARMSGIPMEEAQAQYDAYMLAQADHFAVQDAQVRNTHKTLTEYSFFGLPVRLHNYYSSQEKSMVSAGERLAKNHRIQATGADVLSIAFIKLWNNIFCKLKNPEDFVRFQITVHDEIDFIVRNDVVHIIIPEILKNMQCQMPDWEVPLTIGLSFGPTFGAQYEWNYDPKTFEVLGPKLEMPKAPAPKKEETEDTPKEEKVTIEF